MGKSGVGRLTSSEVHWIVASYIGVSGGYLGDFSQRTHREFYAAYCDLDIDPDAAPGHTTREKFIHILAKADAPTQAAIVRGIARKYPQGSEALRTSEAFKHLAALLKRCACDLSVLDHAPAINSKVVQQALIDAAVLLEQRGPTSAVDRVHTALHGYLRSLCTTNCLPAKEDANVPSLFKCIRVHHPAFVDVGDNEPSIKALQGLAQVVEALNTARNHNSLAHPNEALMDRHEAALAINSARAVIQYLDGKLTAERSAPATHTYS